MIVKVPESTIFIALSEGNTPDDDKQSSENQDDLLYQQYEDKFLMDSRPEAGSGDLA